MKKFLGKNFLLQTNTAKKLYHDFAEELPIIDYHSHLPAQQIADDINFENLTQIWLNGDHYKWRVMRTNGVDESYCTGDKSEYEKFEKWAGTVPFALRNPLYHWALYNLLQSFYTKKKTRLLVKKGIEYISLRMEDVALFYTENKIVYVVDKSGKKFLIDKTLNELETELDKKIFFRVNRQYIVNLSFVKSYKTYEKVKLQLDLVVPNINHFIVISQITASHFRKWIAEEL